ncbi:AT-hook motif nuclear-localized protein 28-like [Tasmannia lanceolata]|uniref:AT-hook motif nuclear-localized protein 28-like n=1 Tax=Tasmannia lanceolata TaxID=3420 RepID=UPI0040643BA2
MPLQRLEIPAGSDIVEFISGFVRRQNVGVFVISGTGKVSRVTIRPLLTVPGHSETRTFGGDFEIITISATFLSHYPSSSFLHDYFMVSLAGDQGWVLGGNVTGPLLASGTLNSRKIVAVGPGARDRGGNLILVAFKEGDSVLLPEY